MKVYETKKNLNSCSYFERLKLIQTYIKSNLDFSGFFGKNFELQTESPKKIVKLCISNRSITIFFVMENKSFFTFKDRVLYPSNLKKNHLTLVLQTKDLINTGSFSKLDSLPLIPKGTGVEGAF